MASVFVLGGTGLLGYHTSIELLARGYQVTTLSLPGSGDHQPAAVQAHWGDATALGEDELCELLTGQHAVCYAIGADERTTPEIPAAHYFYQANVLPTQRLAQLARRCGVAKFVIYGSYTAEWAQRWPDLGYRTRNGYPRTRLAQEEVACLAGAGAMDVMCLRLPYIFGTVPGQRPLWQMFLDRIPASGPILAPAGATSSVTVAQVARAAVGAIEYGAHDGRYPINGYHLSYADFYRHCASAVGRDPAAVTVADLATLLPGCQALDTKIAATGREPGVHLADLAVFQDRQAVSDPAASAVLKMGADDVPAAIAATLAWCIAHPR